jgi:beta-galactosidase
MVCEAHLIMNTLRTYPFIFGAQYYRAPTPEPECWKEDFQHMQELGFNAVKLWVQWRWSQRQPDAFLFDDVDQLMGLAQQHGLQVTINTIFDVSPLWLFEHYPDARQVDASGHTIEPYTVSHRQIGGHPGPCYNHPGAREMRQRFMGEVIDHFKAYPALAMWDVWNEPEQAFQQRTPDMRTLVCYCPHCRRGFVEWLQRKYSDLARLNQVWGRCYTAWEQVELPYNGGTITDFVDWREFHLDTMTAEAAWRLEMVKQHDPAHVRYLHVVPNVMSVFNSVTCVDDFALAEHCEVFAATMNGGPILATQVTSAARGKVCYNVESHINHGCTDLHQRQLDLPDVLKDFLPQLGLGIKGFLFWQYRPEVLGFESPAWGLVGLDGHDRPVTRAVKTFWDTLRPHVDALNRAMPAEPQVGIWKSRRNEIFHFATQGSLQPLIDDVETYIQALYWHNTPFRIISEGMLEREELNGTRLLIMPACYYVSEAEAAALDGWVRRGGVLLNEAHLAGYNATMGRHSRVLPGVGLAAAWGLREMDSTSSYHLHLAQPQALRAAVTEDVRKALQDFGTLGGSDFPMTLADGTLAWGAHRYATLAGDGLTSEATFDGMHPCVVSKPVGKGWVLYCGTNLGQAASHQGQQSFMPLLNKALLRAAIHPTADAHAEQAGAVHVDMLYSETNSTRRAVFAVVMNRTNEPQIVTLSAHGLWRGLYSGADWLLNGPTQIRVPAGFNDLFVVEA